MDEGKKRKLTLVVMAAGMGSRFGGLKQLEPVGPHGEFILEYSAYDAWRHGFEKVIIIVKENSKELFHDAIGNRLEKHLEVHYAVQDKEDVPEESISQEKIKERIKPWGTGHAVLAARNLIDGPFMVINADDYYGAETFKTMAEILNKLKQGQGAAVVYPLKKTMSLHGGVSRGICTISEGKLQKIVEHTEIRYEIDQIYSKESGEDRIDEDTLVSMNVWGFNPDMMHLLKMELEVFLKNISELDTEEFQLPSVVDDLIRQRELEILVGQSHEQWYGITYRMDKASLVRGIEEKIRSGNYPERLWEEQ